MDYNKVNLETRLILAQAADTETEILEQLAKDENKTVRQAIALNPSSPEFALRKLSKEFPEALVQNPIFNVLLLENPENPLVQLAMALNTHTSAKTLERCAVNRDRDVLIAVGSNLHTPIHTLEQLVSEPPILSGHEYAEPGDYHGLFEAIAQNPATPASVLRKISEQWGMATAAIAQNPKTPVDLLEKFSHGKDFKTLLALAQNPATPTTVIAKLLLEEPKQVRDIAKNHPNLPTNADEIICFVEDRPGISVTLLDQLATHPIQYIRQKVAKHPQTSTTTLEKLIQDVDPRVVLEAAHNSNASTEVVNKFALFLIEQLGEKACRSYHEYGLEASQLIDHPEATDDTIRILISVAYTPNTTERYKIYWYHLEQKLSRMKTAPTDVLINIYKHSQDFVTHLSLAKNPSTPAAVIDSTFVDLYNRFQDYKARTLPSNIIPQISSMMKVLHHAIQHNNLSEDLLSIAISAVDLQEWAFKSPNLPIETMRQLVTDSDPKARSVLASNPNLPTDIQQMLAQDSSSVVRAALIKNSTISEALIRKLSEDPEMAVRASVVSNISAPTELLSFDVSQLSLKDRRELSRNPNVSSENLLKLAADNDIEIRTQILFQQSLTVSLIERLVETSLAQISDQISTNEEMREKEAQLMMGLANHPTVPEEVRVEIFKQYFRHN